MATNRVTWIDCAKGLGILTVIIGHTMYGGTLGNILRALIFSFHMPLFFILSSITFRYSTSLGEFAPKAKKAFRHLILPLLAVFLIKLSLLILQSPSSVLTEEFWREQIYSLILGSGVVWQIGDVTIPALGILWFLYVLFSSRTLYDYLQLHFSSHQLQIVVWICSLIGVAIGTSGTVLPFSLDIALAVLPFIALGAFLKDKGDGNLSLKQLALCAAVWLILLRITVPNIANWTYLELAQRRYPFFPLCFISAAAGSLVFFSVGKTVSRISFLSKPLCLLGRDSLYLFLIHHLDPFWSSLWWLEEHQMVSAVLRVCIDLLLFGVFLLLKKLFQKRASAAGGTNT